jgi:hypothetical protein
MTMRLMMVEGKSLVCSELSGWAVEMEFELGGAGESESLGKTAGAEKCLCVGFRHDET